MLDIHAHILPGVDDGAKTPQEGKELLLQMKAQGISAVVATPHFFPLNAVLEDFLTVRTAALKELKAEFEGGFPLSVIPGAEVLYFGGIGRAEAIKNLTLGDSDYLLLELLGLKKIDDSVIRDIVLLKENLGLTPIIAHIERYCKYKGYKKLVSAIEKGKAKCQINATYMMSKAETRAVKNLLMKGIIDFVASDCHNPVSRPVNLKNAFTALREISASHTENIIEKTEKLERELSSL